MALDDFSLGAASAELELASVHTVPCKFLRPKQFIHTAQHRLNEIAQ